MSVFDPVQWAPPNPFTWVQEQTVSETIYAFFPKKGMKHKLRTPYCLEFVHRVSLSKVAGRRIWVQEEIKNNSAKDRTA